MGKRTFFTDVHMEPSIIRSHPIADYSSSNFTRFRCVQWQLGPNNISRIRFQQFASSLTFLALPVSLTTGCTGQSLVQDDGFHTSSLPHSPGHSLLPECGSTHSMHSAGTRVRSVFAGCFGRRGASGVRSCADGWDDRGRSRAEDIISLAKRGKS